MDKTPPVRPKKTNASKNEAYLKQNEREGSKGSAGSPENKHRSPSPEQPCSICLGNLVDKAFTDSCFHMFCFVCLQEWSKVKAECPLCKQKFKNIIHNVRSYDVYDTYEIPTPAALEESRSRRFRYHTTLTLERRFMILNAHPQEHDYTLQRPSHLMTRHHSMWQRRRQASTSDFRRRVYTNNLRLTQIPDARLRVRDISPAFFRVNEACIHRLVPWLNRELNALLHGQSDQVQFLLDLILGLIKNYAIESEEFYQHTYPYIGRHTRHFMQEFECFARSPYNMAVYDQRAIYQPQTENIDDDSESTSSVISVDDHDDVIVLSPTRAIGDSLPTSNPVQPPPPERGNRDATFNSITPLLNRVRSYLECDPVNASGWDSPTPGPSWDIGSHLMDPSSSTRNVFSEIVDPPPPASSWFAASNNSQAGIGGKNTSVSGALCVSSDNSSSDSDVVITEVEKPWADRSPIMLSSDSDGKSKHQHNKKSRRKNHQPRISANSKQYSKSHYSSSSKRSRSRTRSYEREQKIRESSRRRSQSRRFRYDVTTAFSDSDDSCTDYKRHRYLSQRPSYRYRRRDERSTSSELYENSRKRAKSSDSNTSIEVVSLHKKRKSKHKKKDKHKRKKSRKHKKHRSRSQSKHHNKSADSAMRHLAEINHPESAKKRDKEAGDYGLEDNLLEHEMEVLPSKSCGDESDSSVLEGNNTDTSTDGYPSMTGQAAVEPTPGSSKTLDTTTVKVTESQDCDEEDKVSDPIVESGEESSDSKMVFKKHPTGHKRSLKSGNIGSDQEGRSTNCSPEDLAVEVCESDQMKTVLQENIPDQEVVDLSLANSSNMEGKTEDNALAVGKFIKWHTVLNTEAPCDLSSQSHGDALIDKHHTDEEISTTVLEQIPWILRHSVENHDEVLKTRRNENSEIENKSKEEIGHEEEEKTEGDDDEEEEEDHFAGQSVYVCLHNNGSKCIRNHSTMTMSGSSLYPSSFANPDQVNGDDHSSTNNFAQNMAPSRVVNCLELKDDFSVYSSDDSSVSL